jgi:LuxR family maltose regulon positive regulatory protein
VSGIGVPDAVGHVDRSLLRRLAAHLSEWPEPVVLVLDNAEALSNVVEEVDFVLRHSGGQLRVVMVTRVEPDLPLHRYRLDDEVTEIRFPELAFTPDEARGLLERHGVDLPECTLLALTAHTRGWAAGLRLTGSSFDDRTGPAGTTDPATAADGDIGAYFRTEVLDGYPSGVRSVLLTTSVVDRLPAGLAAHLCGSKQAVRTLQQLARAGAFIEWSAGADDCYEYHPLVRELLRAELERESPARYRWLHRKAARWLVASGWPIEAADQYAAVHDWKDAATLLVRDLAVARLLATSPNAGLTHALAGMPADLPGPEAAAVGAALALARHDLDGCDDHLARATELAPTDAGGRARLGLAVAVTAAARAGVAGDAPGTATAVAAARDILAGLAAGGVGAAPETDAVLLWSAGRGSLATGDLDAARDSLAAAVRAADPPGSEYLRARCLADLALTEAISGRLRRAVGLAHKVAAIDGLTSFRPAVADVALAWVGAEQAKLRDARGFIDAATANAEIRRDPVALGALALVRSWLRRARGDLAGAVAALRQARSADVPPPEWLLRRLDAAETVLLIAQGRGQAALTLARRAGAVRSPESVVASGWAMVSTGAVAEAGEAALQVLRRSRLPLDVHVDALLLTAASEMDRAPQAAKEALSRALRLAAPERLRRPFQQTTPRVRKALREQEGAPAEGHRANGTPPAGAAATGDPLGTGHEMVQALTEREQEVLTYLAALLPTEEIAGRMFVSVNTVKTHVRAILRKLSAGRRNDAIRRARELGLV